MCGLPRWGTFHDPLLVVGRLDFVADNAAFVPALHLSRIGVGLVVVVLVDAAMARAVVLAATMKAAGVWNWYPTGWLAGCPGATPPKGRCGSDAPLVLPRCFRTMTRGGCNTVDEPASRLGEFATASPRMILGWRRGGCRFIGAPA
jgi:hypothetical protein